MRRLLLLGLLACQGKQEPPPPAAASVQVRDSSGVLVAELRPIRPCRGSIGPVDLIVGGPPLVANLGSTEWKGSAADNGTTLYRDGQPVVRVFPTGDPKTVSVLDLHGIALARIALNAGVATVTNSASVPVRSLRIEGDTIKADKPALTITGTQDLVLGALLSAPELSPEVRVLAACERVLVKDT
jgi:hypothetical protein